MHPHFTKEEAQDFVKRTAAKKVERLKNPYDFTEDKINNLDDIAKKISSKLFTCKRGKRIFIKRTIIKLLRWRE